MEGESAELCGIPGEEDETLTKGEFNRLVSQVKFYHYRPQQQAIARIEKMITDHHVILQEHITSDAQWFAKLAGAKWALYTIAAILAFLLPLIWQLIKALETVGIL